MPDEWSDFSFELTTPANNADEAAIRQLLVRNSIPGAVTLTYEREPNYFLACSTMGRFCQVLVARHRPTGEVIGVATRTTRPLFVNGQVEEVGYIGQLRVDRSFQGRWLVSRGFRFFHQLHADGRVNGYLTTIIEGNTQAEGVLVKRARRHFPAYREVDRLCTLALILRRPKKMIPCPFKIDRGNPGDIKEIVTFLKRYGPAKQFFPVYTEADFVDNATTRDFRIEDFVVARQKGEIVGLTGLWDQSRYKQTIVRQYNNALRWLKPFYNGTIRWFGGQSLPAVGQAIHFAYGSFICIAENKLEIFRPLLRHLYNLAAERNYAYLMIGLSTRDPLLAVARQYAHIPYYSRLYTVCWPGEETFHTKLDGRLPYIEIASL